MKVAIDTTPLKTGHQYRGIGTYTQNLVESLQNSNLLQLNLEMIDNGQIPNECDLIHYPFFDLFFLTLPLKKEKPTVVTIHDVIPLVLSEHFPAGLRGSLRLEVQKLSLKGVKAVITDSENSKKDIFKYLDYPKNKIYVIPLAPAKDFRVIKDKNYLNKIKRQYNLPQEFVLYVGDVNYNKNIVGLVKAFALLKSYNSHLKLVLVGKAFLEKNLKETQEILQLINSLKLNDSVIRLGWVPQGELVAIYNLATVYCQPSFYEGFGLPVLEAMACGCPVVAAKTSSLPEICDKAVEMVDPYNINSIAEGIKKVIGNKVKRETLKKLGLSWVKNFSWEKVARETYEIYQKVV